MTWLIIGRRPLSIAILTHCRLPDVMLIKTRNTSSSNCVVALLPDTNIRKCWMHPASIAWMIVGFLSNSESVLRYVANVSKRVVLWSNSSGNWIGVNSHWVTSIGLVFMPFKVAVGRNSSHRSWRICKYSLIGYILCDKHRYRGEYVGIISLTWDVDRDEIQSKINYGKLNWGDINIQPW